MEPTIYYLLAGTMVVIGIAGMVLPAIPGVLFVFGGLFVAAWADHFTRVGIVGLSIIGVLGVLAFVADFVASAMGAKRVGASPQAVVGATVGSLIGLFFGIAGLLLGPFVGAVVGELLAKGRLAQAGKVGVGTWLGLLAAAVLKVVIAFLMIGTWGVFYLMNGA